MKMEIWLVDVDKGKVCVLSVIVYNVKYIHM